MPRPIANTGDPREKPTTLTADGGWRIHPAYEGWAPSEPRDLGDDLRGFLLVAVCVALTFAAIHWMGL